MAGCMYWARPDIELPEDTMGAAADEGVRLHALAERLADGHTVPSADVQADIADRWAQMVPWIEQWRDATTGAERLVEAAFKINVQTGVVSGIPRSAGRNYGHSMTEVPARLDLGAVWPDLVEIWDFKTGETAPKACDAGQLRTLALMVCEAWGKSRARVHIVHVRDDNVYTDSHDLERWDLDGHALLLRRSLESLPVAVPAPGAHCRWCPARTLCPAVVTSLVAATTLSIDTPADLARVHYLLKPMEDAIAALKARIRLRVEADGGVLALPGGRQLRIVRTGGGESVDIKALARCVGDAGMAKLREEGAVKSRSHGSYVKETKGE